MLTSNLGYKRKNKMNAITYDLLGKDDTSDCYYGEISELTDEILNNAVYLYPAADNLMNYIASRGIEKLRTREEYVYDLISIGVYWNIYGPAAMRSQWEMMKSLAFLYNLRRKYKKIKPQVDKLRGWLSTVFLSRHISDERRERTPDLRQLNRLILWLESTGEFREEVKRYKLWSAYWHKDGKAYMFEELDSAVSFARWFEARCGRELYRHTFNVDNFRLMKHPAHKWKEDYIFCGRQELEYHLSMVGAEIMNRAYKKDFASTNKRAVLLPACMRSKPEGECKGVRVGLEYICAGCDSGCEVNKITRIGKQEGFETRIIPHSSDFSAWLETWAAGKGIGVVGVACPLNLITGGLEMKALDVPAQCVLLDYCGCKDHWDEKGVSTRLNIGELLNKVKGGEPAAKAM